MGLSKLSGLILGLFVIMYLLGLLGNVLLFVIFVPVAFLLSMFVLLSTFANFIYRIGEKSVVLLSSVIALLLGGWAINHFLLPGILTPTSMFGNVAILLFTVFLAYTLLDKKRKKNLFIGTAVFILIISFLYGFWPRIQIVSAAKKVHGEDLKSLPYLSFVVNEKAFGRDGVVMYDSLLSYPGLNLYSSFSSSAHLSDMSGNTIHSWASRESDTNWNQVRLNTDSDLLVSIRDEKVMSLDWGSNVKWQTTFRSHHDLAADENRNVYALARKDEIVFVSGLPVPILNDYLIVLSSDGQIKQEISFFKLLKDHISLNRVQDLYSAILHPGIFYRMLRHKFESDFLLNHDTRFDIFHNNTVTIIDRDVVGLCKAGDVLVSIRQLNLIGIIDLKDEKLVWTWGSEVLDKQHHPTLLPTGNVLVFDNGRQKKRSRVIEVNPLTREIVWQYTSTPPESFYSSLMGGAQRLPNGNTLITESDKGRAFEVTKDGEIVWEFYNPEKRNDKRAVIYRMIRLPLEMITTGNSSRQ